jgi:ribose-phosphate pyrophosphokinase
MSHGREIKIFTGNANKPLAESICQAMGLTLGGSDVSAFADGETSVSLHETVRGLDVFIIQPTCTPVNTNLMELLIMIDACKRASAGRITAVVPYFGYARQDRKAKARDPISAKLVANLITVAGADRVLTMDLHASQIQGFFDIPVDNLLGGPLFAEYYTEKFGAALKNVIVVSPDVGSVTRARAFAQRMGLGGLAIIDKRREQANQSDVMNIIGHVRGKTVLMIDDILDTAGSLCGAAKALVETGGAEEIYACASHGLLSDPAVERIERSYIKELRFLDTIPYRPNTPCGKIGYIQSAQLFAEAIKRTYEEVSISTLFN